MSTVRETGSRLSGMLTYWRTGYYGFLRPLDGGADVYVNQLSFDDAGIACPVMGKVYEFTVVPGRRPGQLQAKLIGRIDDKATEAEAVKKQQIEEAYRQRERYRPKFITPTSVEY